MSHESPASQPPSARAFCVSDYFIQLQDADGAMLTLTLSFPLWKWVRGGTQVDTKGGRNQLEEELWGLSVNADPH